MTLTCQGELKLGSQIIKFGKYVKLLNSQLSLHITLWICKKANIKMYALYCYTASQTMLAIYIKQGNEQITMVHMF